MRKTEEKQGQSGRLTFLTIAHEIHQDGHLVIDEEQDLVYRDEAVAGAPAEERATDPLPLSGGEWAVPVSPPLLFRFSALTYNAHRVHYDRDYAREVEGYPGLLTHGPLQALAMAEIARAADAQPAACTFTYRLTSPLFEHQGLVAAMAREGASVQTRVRDSRGRQTARGTIVPL